MGKQNKATTTHRFSHGDRVFAKMKGYPFWPARIEQLPNEINGLKDKYEVLFYGTYQTITLKAEFLVSYNEETKQQYGQKRKQKSFNEALHEIEFDPNLEQKNDESEKQIEEINEEISETQSSNQDDEEEELDTESNETKSVKSTDEVKTIKQKYDIEPSRRSSRRAPKSDRTDSIESQQQTKILKEQQNESTSSSSTSSSKKLAGKRRSEQSSRLASNQSETASIKSEELENSAFSNSPPPPPTTTTLPEQEEPVNTINPRRQSSRPTKPNKRYSNNADQEEISTQPSAKIKRKVSTNIDEKSTNSSKKIIKAKRQRSNSQLSSASYTSSKSDSNKTNDNFDNDQNNSVNSSIDNTMIVEPTLVENVTISKSIESETKSQAEIVNTDKELEKKINFKNSLKEKKKKEKKLAFILSIRIEISLERMDREIKKSLRVDKTDVNRCCLIMQDLIKLPFSRKHMLKSPAIIETIRKCRKFKDSETVRNLSNEFFNKLYNIFTVSSEAFKDVFDKEKSKYLNENEKEIKKERIWKEKCLNEDKRISSGGAKRLITSNSNRKHSKSFNLDRKDSTELFFSSVHKQSINNIDTTNECFDSEAQD